MIDISQWRATIGVWYCHQIPYTKAKKQLSQEVTSESLWSKKSNGNNLTFSLVLAFLLLLILSGDIELNPGPKTGKH